MQVLLGLSRLVDRVTAVIGRSVSWLILLAVLVSAANAISRKAFALSSNAWLELQWYLFGAAFLLAAAYTLQRNEHIRIDIVSNLLPKAVRDWIDVFGHLFMLLPFTVIIVNEAYPTFRRAFLIGETSSNFGGLLIWPIKAVVIAGFGLLFLQGLSELIKRLAIIRGIISDPASGEPHQQVPVE